MDGDGHYLYAIVAAGEEKTLGVKGMGEAGDEVHTVCHRDIGAVVSRSPVVTYSVSRANTMAHQKVMEEVMEYYSLLPVRFGTVGEGVEAIREKVLEARYDELKECLEYVEDKVELGLKALWTDTSLVFREIVEESRDIRLLRQRLTAKKGGGTQREQVRLGEMVKAALDRRRVRDEKAVLEGLKGLWVEHKGNTTFGDRMITNSAFLVKRDQEKKFDGAMERASEKFTHRMRFNYVGPVPPCNFVEISVTW